MKPNYQGNKKRKEEDRRKKQEAKRLKRLNKGDKEVPQLETDSGSSVAPPTN